MTMLELNDSQWALIASALTEKAEADARRGGAIGQGLQGQFMKQALEAEALADIIRESVGV